MVENIYKRNLRIAIKVTIKYRNAIAIRSSITSVMRKIRTGIVKINKRHKKKELPCKHGGY